MTVVRRPVAFSLVALFILSGAVAVEAEEGPGAAPNPPVEVLPDHVARYESSQGRGGPTPITSSSTPSGVDVRVGRDHVGAGDLLVSEDWLRARVPDFATTNAYSQETVEGKPWIRVPLEEGRGAQAVSFTAFLAEVGERQFSRGSGDSVWLAERPMSITILEVPGEQEITFEDENGTKTESVRIQRLAIDFDDGDSTGQSLQYDQAWLEGLGFEDPVFRSSDGEVIPAKLVDGTYVVFAPHFSIVYTFNSDEGFTREADRTYSHVYWSSADSAVIIQQDKRDSLDEILSKPLPVSFTTSVGGEVQAVHTVTTQGNHQSHIPLFITKSSNTDINTGASSAYYYLQGGASTDTSRLYMRVRDASGTLAFEDYISAPSNVERELSIEYSPPNTFYFRVADRSGGYVTTSVATVSSYMGLQFDKWGFASNGWSGASEPVQYAKVDDAVLRYGTQDSNPPCLDTSTDGGGYRCSKVNYAPVSMSGSTQLSLGDDAISSSISLPFSFPFYGSSYSQVKVSSNGFVSFDGGTDNGCCTGDNLPTTSTPNAVVACGWEDLDPTRSVSGFNPPKIHYRSVGSPATKWVVEYDNIYSYQTSATYLGTGNKFQIHLEPDGDIYCMLEDIVDDTDTLPTTIGIENAAGTQGTRYLHGEAGVRNVGIKFFKEVINNDAPYTPANPVPNDGAVRQPASMTLDWTGGDPDGDPVTYTVYLESGDPSPDVVRSCSNPQASSCPVSYLTRGAHYYWFVVADDGIEQSTGLTWDFYVNRLPYAPSSPSPGHNTRGVDPSPTLTWSGGDPDWGDSVTYTVYLESGDSSPDVVQPCANPALAECSLTDLSEGVLYYWKVVATDSTGESTSGPTWFFRVNNDPYAPSSPTPSPGADGQLRDLTLAWSGGDPDATPVTYTVYLENGDPSPDVVVPCSNPQHSECAVYGLTRGGHYYWRVVSDDGISSSDSGLPWDFYVNRLPNACFSIQTVDDRTVHVDSSCSSDPEDTDTNLQFEWIWGDGTTTTSHGDTTVSHRYAACPVPNPTITLWVRDASSEWSATGTSSSPTLTDEDDDQDGLHLCEELAQGTTDGDPDFDDDGLNDFVESASHPNRVAIFCEQSTCAFPDPTSPDVYVEIDYMVRPAEFVCTITCVETRAEQSYKPTSAQLATVSDYLASEGVNIHFDNGQLGGGNEVPYTHQIRDVPTAGAIDFYDYRDGGDGITARFDDSSAASGGRGGIFHYMLFGDHYLHTSSGETMSSGFAPNTDEDVFIASGRIWDISQDISRGVDYDVGISGTVIHELGHNFCLKNDITPNTPCEHKYIDDDAPEEYQSSMSYTHQFHMVRYSHGSDPTRDADGDLIDHNDWAALRLDSFVSGGSSPGSTGAPASSDISMKLVIFPASTGIQELDDAMQEAMKNV